MTDRAAARHDELANLLKLVAQFEPTAERKTVKSHDRLEYVVVPTSSENRSIIFSSSQGHIRCEEFVSGWGEPTITTIFAMVDGATPQVTYFNLSYALNGNCLRLLKGLDKAWNGAISEAIRWEANDILARWV